MGKVLCWCQEERQSSQPPGAGRKTWVPGMEPGPFLSSRMPLAFSGSLHPNCAHSYKSQQLPEPIVREHSWPWNTRAAAQRSSRPQGR